MPFTNGHALLIGVGTYCNAAQMNVPITARDAEEVQSVLADSSYCGYPDDQVTLLRDGNAHRDDVLSALDRLKAVEPDDTVFLFYCGHGDYGTDGRYYFTTHDTQLQNGRVKAGTGVSESELLDKLRDIPAKRLLLIFNACHSGEISPSLSLDDQAETFGNKTLSADTADAILSTGEGRIIITACRPNQVSYIGDGSNTIFTTALLAGLRGEGEVTSRGGYISAYDLYQQVYFGVKTGVDEIGKVQEPELTILRGVGPFPVALNHGALSLGGFDDQAKPPAETAVRTVDPATSERKLASRIQVSGTGNVTAGGDIRDSTIIAGSGNTVQTAKGSNIAQAAGGGTATVNDHSSHSVFDQRGQKVKTQYNIAGDYQPGAAHDPTAALQQLRMLVDELNRAGAENVVPKKAAVTARQAVENALMEAEEPKPAKQSILDHLTTATETIAAVAGGVGAATGLVTALSQAVQMVQRLF